ncbi:ethanolamine utilization protein EutJ [Ectothiorhodospiraceae bacterium WFHF3C12]|nr:ethanolamine utilization protein EutJ [Ectothiorhodospiraceae bacterium WFHF3C12]
MTMLQCHPQNEEAVMTANSFLTDAVERFREPTSDITGDLHFGVDLGTATVVLCAVDDSGRPVYWDFVRCGAVRDGVVVNFSDAATAVTELKGRAEELIGIQVQDAATAHPPGVPKPDARACKFVLETAEIECRNLVDEISAAQALLCLREGALVDVGGGSTGVGIVEDGRIVAVDDRSGGGWHLDLILAGSLGIPIEDAERLKRDGAAEHAPILRPGIERIAASVQQQISGRRVESVHLVGGALRVSGSDDIISKYLGIAAIAYPHSELVTPFGIAMS